MLVASLNLESLRKDTHMLPNGLGSKRGQSFDGLNKPLVSVVIPIFNGRQYVETLFSTLNNQTFTDFEVVIVDDGSSDDTLQQIKKATKTFNKLNVRAIPSSHQGLAATRNTGIRHSRGRYLAFLDCDDSWQDDKLKSQVDYLERTECVAVFSKVSLVSIDGLASLSKSNLKSFAESPVELIARDFVVYGGGSNVMCRRQIFDVVGGFDETLDFAEDFDMWVRLSKVGRIVELPQRLVEILVRPNSMQRIRSTEVRLGLLKSRILILNKWISDYPSQVKNEIAFTMAEELYEALKEMNYRYIVLICAFIVKPNADSTMNSVPFWLRTHLLMLTVRRLQKFIVRRFLGKMKTLLKM